MRVELSSIAAALVASALSLQPARGSDDPPQSEQVRASLRALEEPNPSAREAAARALAARGEEAALAALADLHASPVEARRLRAWLAHEAGGPDAVDPALEALDDPDPTTRGWLVAFLGQVDLREHAIDRRVAALGARALEDADPRVRRQAWNSLADLSEPAAEARLDTAFDALSPGDRVDLAAALAQRSSGRAWILARMVRAFASGERAGASGERAGALEPDLLFTLFPAYSRALAELPNGGDAREERAPIVVCARDGDLRLRAAAIRALDALVRRMVFLNATERAERVLLAFASDGLEPAMVLYHRVRVALASGVASERAAELAGQLAALGPPEARGAERAVAGRSRGDRIAATLWSARALELQATSWLAAGKLDLVSDPLAREASILDAELAERADLEGKSGAARQELLLHQRASTALLGVVLELARTLELDPAAHATEIASAERAAVALATVAHRLELEAQACAWRATRPSSRSWDVLLDTDDSPLALVLDNPRLAAWPAVQALALRARLGRALATVAPWEMPGFAPFDGVDAAISDPLADPARLVLLQRVQLARHDSLRTQFNQLLRRMREQSVEDLSGPAPEDELALIELEQELGDTLEALQKGPSDGWKELRDLRVPSSYGLWLARDLRADGQTAEARAQCEAVRADLEKNGQSQRYIWGLEFLAEIEMTIGSSYSDDDEPERAERELGRALERLEGIENLMKERGFGGPELGFLRTMRASTLVSLAVNANVKLNDQPKALAYFDRAFELRQDDFMRVLRACYRARAGRTAEARAILRDVAQSPGTLYNTACTWSLLGERELALEFLRREFDENQQSPGAREKQREWARKDPDLELLRDDPRFKELVGP